MSSYYVDFKNDTERVWTMAVYQKLPDSVGLDSVSWKQTTVPRLGLSGVKWDVNYNVVIADYTMARPLGVYMASQTLPTLLGKKWKCVYEEGCQQLIEDGNGTPGHILIANESGFKANLGIGMDGQGSVFKKGVYGGENAQFRVEPTYYIGLFRNVVLGEVISSNVIIGPVELKYTGDKNSATLRLYTEGETTKFKVSYSIKGELTDADRMLLEARDFFTRNPGALPAWEMSKLPKGGK